MIKQRLLNQRISKGIGSEKVNHSSFSDNRERTRLSNQEINTFAHMHPWIRQTFYALVLLINCQLLTANWAKAGNISAADIYYQCIDDTTYQVTVAMYWDCEEVKFPLEVTVSVSSESCGEQFFFAMDGVPPDITVVPTCPSVLLNCSGGTVPGVRRLLFSGVVTLPAQCNDWEFRFRYDSRFAADNIEPGQWIYVTANLDNTQGCNSSPTFSNPPVDYICADDTFCFLQGTTDIDGDSLVYSLVEPLGFSGDPVTYDSIFNGQNPFPSTPDVFVDPATGNICMNPDTEFVAVLAVQIDEYRNGVWVGNTVRDMRFNIRNCSNSNPSLSGMNGTNTFFDTTCADTPICFDIFSSDPDSGQTLSMTWNEGIALGNSGFTVNPDTFPSASFCWTPEEADTSMVPYCFDVTVRDDNCPYEGHIVRTYCIVVQGTTADATILPVDAFCPSDVAMQLPSVSQGGLWSGSGITNANLGVFDPGVAGTGAHTIIHQAFGDCNNSDTATLYVEPVFDATVTGYPDSICLLDAEYPLTAMDFGGFWSGPGIVDTTSGIFNAELAGVGTHEIIYRIGSACGDRDTVSIEVLPVPDPSITTSNLEYCITEIPFDLTSANGGGVWTGNGITDANAGTFDASVAGAGEHEIVYQLSNQFCSNTDTVVVIVAPMPNPQINPIAPRCDNAPGFYMQASQLGGTWSGPGVTLPELGYFNPPSAGAGTHQIIYTFDGTCFAADTIDVVVNEAPVVEITSDIDTICQSAGVVTLSGSPTGGMWFGVGITSNQNGTLDPSIGATGPRSIQYKYDDGTCDATAFGLIVVVPSPTEPNVQAPDTACEGDIISGLFANGNGTINWYADTNLDSLVGIGGQLNMNLLGTDTLWVTNSLGGCETEPVMVVVTFYPKPTASMDDTPEGAYVDEDVLFTNSSLGADFSHWDFGDGTTATNQLNGDQVHAFPDTGIYVVMLVVENEYGCTDTFFLDLEVVPPAIITIPTVFTPNGDNVNDTWKIEGEYLLDFKAQIFNRWGKKVYEWEDINQGWDGKNHSGQALSAGTYYYVITAVARIGAIGEKGFLELIK